MPSLPSSVVWQPSVAADVLMLPSLHLLRRDGPLLLLLPTRGDNVVAAVFFGVAALRRCCYRRATTLPPLMFPLRRGNPPSLLLLTHSRCRRCHLLRRGDPLSLLPPTRGNDAVAAVSCGVATLCRCCHRHATALSLLMSPLRRGNLPSLLMPTLPSPATSRSSAAATANVWQQFRCCHLLWRGDPPSLLLPMRVDAPVATVSAAVRQSIVVAGADATIYCGVATLTGPVTSRV